MGDSKKGFGMKINEFVAPINGQKLLASKQQQADFGQWLDEPSQKEAAINWAQLASPTQQSTGDEYYWQHQNQLQQSELHFDAQPIENQQQKLVSLSNNEPVFNAPIHQEVTEQTALQQQQNNPIKNGVSPNSYTKKFALIITELEQALEQSSVDNTNNNNKLSVDAKTECQAIRVSRDTLNNTMQFKNNHLFIQGEQAELTLNMHQFNKQEQKELIQMIQDHLKKKGLVISHLIINGVRND
jgi:hypothetical protein